MMNPVRRSVTEPEAVSNVQMEEKVVQTIEVGRCFGDMTQEDSVRETNAVAVETSEMLCINRKTYETLLKAQLKS
jgi:hypothetical protein